MRRFRQMMDEDRCRIILSNATNGVLSLVDETDTPYGVPISFVYDDNNAIYFHCAKTGYKLDCIRHESRCSFCVIDKDEIKPEEFTTYFRSVIVSGSISIVTDKEEMIKGLKMLGDKYSPGIDSNNEIEKGLNHLEVLRLDISEMTGKEAIELVKARNKDN